MKIINRIRTLFNAPRIAAEARPLLEQHRDFVRSAIRELNYDLREIKSFLPQGYGLKAVSRRRRFLGYTKDNTIYLAPEIFEGDPRKITARLTIANTYGSLIEDANRLPKDSVALLLQFVWHYELSRLYYSRPCLSQSAALLPDQAVERFEFGRGLATGNFILPLDNRTEKKARGSNQSGIIAAGYMSQQAESEKKNIWDLATKYLEDLIEFHSRFI